MKKRLGKAAIWFAILAIVILCVGFIDVQVSYTVQADNSNLQECLTQFINRGKTAETEVKLYDSVDIGNRRVALIELTEGEDSVLGFVHLDRGWNGRYKIDFTHHGSGSLKKEVVASGQQKYVVIGGRNAYFGITSIDVELHGERYTLEIPEGDRFLVCTEVDPLTETGHINWGNIRLYDRDGADITDPVMYAGSVEA